MGGGRPVSLGPRLHAWLRLQLAWARLMHPDARHAIFAWAAGVGALGGGLSCAFRAALVPLQLLFTGHTGGLVAAAAALPPWARLMAPAVGGYLAGWVLALGLRTRKDPDATDFMEAIGVGSGDMPARPVLRRCASSLLSIASGGALGREGPMVQLAAMTASRLGQRFAVSAPRLRLLVACGVAAGIAAAYRAPLAGTLFVAEVVLGAVTMESLGPLIFAALAATLAAGLCADAGPLYATAGVRPQTPWALVAYAGLGLGAGVLGPSFLAALAATRVQFKTLAARGWPPAWRLALGGLMVGALSVGWPEVWGNGNTVVAQLLVDPGPLPQVAMLFVVKALAVIACVGSGAVGGVFTPTLFLGAAWGTCMSRVVHGDWAAALPDHGAYALVGMGAMLAATTHAPWMAIVMIYEMTHNYDMVLPLMVACLIAATLSHKLRAASIYTEALPQRRGHNHGALSVARVMQQVPVTVRRTASFAAIAAYFARAQAPCLYVVGPAGTLAGAIYLDDVAQALHDDLGHLVMAADIMGPTPRVLTPEMSLWAAAAALADDARESLPVCRGGPAGVLVGTLSRSDLLLVMAHGPGDVRVA